MGTLTKKKKKVRSQVATESVTPTKTEKKKGTVNKAELSDANAASVAKKITDKKELKYKYPKEADSLPERKKFRAEVRRKLRAMEKMVKKLEMSKLAEDMELLDIKQKELDKYKMKVLKNPFNEVQ